MTRTIAALLSPFVLAACGTIDLPPAPGSISPDASREFILFGDTQKTMTLEFWRPHYDAERRVLIRAVADERPAFVVRGIFS